MQMQSEGKSVEQIVAAIQTLDLDPIKVKLMHSESGEGWSRKYADRMELGYRRFLTLMAKYPDATIAPTMDIDEFWHYHILDTLKYAEDCQNVFGHFLHHFPYLGMRGEDDTAVHDAAGETMQKLYEEEFGEPLSDLTAPNATANETAFSAATGKSAKTAFSAAASKTAFSAATSRSAKTAFSATAGKTAFSAAAGKSAKTAFSAAASKTAFSAASKPTKSAFSAAANSEDRMNVWLRPTLALAA